MPYNHLGPLYSGSEIIRLTMKLMLGIRPTDVVKPYNATNCVISIRHPYDSILSIIFEKKHPVTQKTLRHAIEQYFKSGGNALLDKKIYNNRGKYLVIQYENTNMKNTIEAIAKYYNVIMTDGKKQFILNELSNQRPYKTLTTYKKMLRLKTNKHLLNMLISNDKLNQIVKIYCKKHR